MNCSLLFCKQNKTIPLFSSNDIGSLTISMKTKAKDKVFDESQIYCNKTYDQHKLDRFINNTSGFPCYITFILYTPRTLARSGV